MEDIFITTVAFAFVAGIAVGYAIRMWAAP